MRKPFLARPGNMLARPSRSMTRRQFLAGTAASAAAWTLAACGGSGGGGSGSGGAITGLDFPGSAAVGLGSTMRFRFQNPLSIYPATYIWRAYPRKQEGFYTAFFWGNDGAFQWKAGSADSYYGAHPFPNHGSGASIHDWEIAVESIDPVNGAVVYDQWYTQALRVWSDVSGKHHEFYWDLPSTDASHRVSYTAPTSYGNTNPPIPALTWGDAPWNPGYEVWNGILRGFQVYETNLSVSEILSEAGTPLSTTAGLANIWYLNLNPTPSDITDKSGSGHHPEWVGTMRPALWSG